MRASLTLLFLKLALITCLGAQTGQPVPPAHVPGDSSTYARAMTRYYGADYGAARALLFRAAREYEDAGQLDSAAAALMHYGDTYVNVRALQALEVAYADTLAPLARATRYAPWRVRSSRRSARRLATGRSNGPMPCPPTGRPSP